MLLISHDELIRGNAEKRKKGKTGKTRREKRENPIPLLLVFIAQGIISRGNIFNRPLIKYPARSNTYFNASRRKTNGTGETVADSKH